MDPSFGTRLRMQRERQRIAISTIAAKTKINPSLLHGLERDDVSNWPEGIFRRAYIRDYARAIGLDPDAVVREFMALHPDSVTVLPAGASVWPEPADDAGQPHSPTGLGRIVTIARAAMPAVLRGAQKNGAAVNARSTAMVRPAPVERFRPEPDVSALARLCTRLGRTSDARGLVPLLAEAVTMLDAVGLILWYPDDRATVLMPSLVHGYPDAVLARLANVPVDADNAVAAAFRTADVRVVDGDGVTGAVVVPLLDSRGCRGVLAVELPQGRERSDSIRAFAVILAAQLAALARR